MANKKKVTSEVETSATSPEEVEDVRTKAIKAEVKVKKEVKKCSVQCSHN